jgi:hypothetical protein
VKNYFYVAKTQHLKHKVVVFEPMGGLKNIGGVLSAYNAMDLRQDAKKVVVLLTSGRDFSSEDVSVIGSALKKDVKVFAISVGLIHDVTTLKKFAKIDHIHHTSHIKHKV